MKPIKKSTTPLKKSTEVASRKTTNKSYKQTDSTVSLFETLEHHLQQKKNTYLFLIIGLAFFLSILCFDAKISLANDDALYIESGAKYAKDFFAKESFYLANAPLYPTLLGLIIKVFGVNLIVLKFFSILFFCSGLFLLFIAFRNRIPYTILIPSLL